MLYWAEVEKFSMHETHTHNPDVMNNQELDSLIEQFSEQVVKLAFAIEVKVIRQNTLQGVSEIFTELTQLRVRIEELSGRYPDARKKLNKVWVMIELLTTGVQIGDKRRGLLEAELGETKRAL